MKKFKIKCIKHLLKNNEIAVFGEEIEENKFIDLKSSIKGGFIEEIDFEEEAKKLAEKKAKKEAKKQAKAEKKAKKEAKKQAEENSDNEDNLEKKLSKMKKADLIAFAEKNNYIIDANENMKLIIKDILDQEEENSKEDVYEANSES